MTRQPANLPPTSINEVDSLDDDRTEEASPDGGYGWVCVAACFTINCFTWGTVAAYGVYLSHYLASDSFPEASAWDYAFIGGFNFSIAMLIAPIVTILTRNFGIHATMAVGLILESGGFVAASFATQIWQLHISQGVLVGCGIGFLYIPSLPVLSQWFVQRRTFANGISAAGSGVGGAAFAWGTEAIIRHLSVGWALRIMGLIVFAANLVAIIVIRDRNNAIQPSQLGFDTNLLRRYDVILLLSWVFITMLGYVPLVFSLSNFALSIGLSKSQATDVIGLLNVGTAVGRPVIGILSDRWSRLDTAGVLTLTIGPLCVEVAGIKNLQSLLSLSWAAVVIPATVSEGIALKLRWSSSSREYLYTQIFAGISYIVASGFLLQLRRLKNRKPQDDPI
ncbi:MAG: hypothetical protein Q9219_005942 [cf. Caloplaca sp. 3 TL-2023]